MKASVEHLTHFNCYVCSMWFSVGDLPTRFTKLYCPYCGRLQEIEYAKEVQTTEARTNTSS